MYRPKSQQPILGLDIRTLRIYQDLSSFDVNSAGMEMECVCMPVQVQGKIEASNQAAQRMKSMS